MAPVGTAGRAMSSRLSERTGAVKEVLTYALHLSLTVRLSGEAGGVMVFVLDNYDSFTYNLVQYMGELGAEMVIRRNDELTPEEIEATGADRILISPGPCTPQDAGVSIDLIGTLPVAERSVWCRFLASVWGIRRLVLRLAEV